MIVRSLSRGKARSVLLMPCTATLESRISAKAGRDMPSCGERPLRVLGALPPEEGDEYMVGSLVKPAPEGARVSSRILGTLAAEKGKALCRRPGTPALGEDARRSPRGAGTLVLEEEHEEVKEDEVTVGEDEEEGAADGFSCRGLGILALG